jgi:hypothetical protein
MGSKVMARYSSKSLDEVPSKDTNADKRKKPHVANRPPYSPAQVEALYNKGKETVGRREWLHADHQANQDPIDRHQDNGRWGRYDNDCKGYVRGAGGDATKDRPGGFDHGKYDIGNKPDRHAAGGKPNTATGSDVSQSPFSAAHRKGQGEGF